MNCNRAVNQHTGVDTFTMVLSALVLIAFTVLSCCLNAVYAVAHGEDVSYHVALPILALLAGVFAEVIFLSNVNRVARWITGTLVTGGFVAVMVASYIAVRGVAYEKYPTFPNPLKDALAAFPDGFMIIAATVLLGLRMRRTRIRNAATKVTETRVLSRWRRLADAAANRMEAALAVPENQRVTAVDVREPAPEPAANRAPKVPDAVREPATKRPVKPKSKVREPAVNPELEPYLPAAKWMLERREVTRKTDIEVAAIIKLVNDGLNSYEIRKQVGGSTDTADKVSRAWRQWQEQQRDGQHEWQLSAVG